MKMNSIPTKYVELAERIASNLEDWANPNGESEQHKEFTGHANSIRITLEGFDELLDWLRLNRSEDAGYAKAAYDALISEARKCDALLKSAYKGEVSISEKTVLGLAFTLRSIVEMAEHVVVDEESIKDDMSQRLYQSLELVKEFRSTFLRWATVESRGKYPLDTFDLFFEGLPEEATGTSRLNYHPHTGKISCRFRPETGGKELSFTYPETSCDLTEYERLLFSKWSYDDGYALDENERSRAVWFIEDQSIADRFQDIAEKVDGLLNTDARSFPLVLPAEVLSTIRNNRPKWKPSRVSWSYVRELDERILDLERELKHHSALGEREQEDNLVGTGQDHAIEVDKETEKETTPDDKPVRRDSVKEWFALDGIIPHLTEARIKEEEDFRQNVAGKSEPRKITSKFFDNAEETFSKETRAFLNRQEKEIKRILEYIAKVCELEEKHQWPSGTVGLLKELMDWESGSFKFELDDEDVEEAGTVECRITGPVTHYIEEKSDLLSKLHALLIKKFAGCLTGEIAVKTDYALSSGVRSKIELLTRQFEDGASKHPGLANMVMSWPFMHLMPRPPKEYFPDFELPKMREKKYSFDLMSCSPLVTSETMASVFFRAKDEAGLNRFRALATEAGQIVAEVVFDYKEPLWPCNLMQCSSCDEKQGRIWCFKDIPHRSINLWLQAIHMFRRTLVCHDGWDGLFDEDSDFSDEGYHKGLYNFWESKDVFLDSALVCNMLLNNAKIHQNPTKEKKNIWEDVSSDMKKAIQDFRKESEAKKSEGKRLLIKNFCRERGIDEKDFKSERDRVEKRMKRLKQAHK